ncbi:MAG: oligosaccharide flippase family protein [Terriglobales bacterium]
MKQKRIQPVSALLPPKHPPPQQSHEARPLCDLKARTARGGIAVMMRQFGVHGLNALGAAILARLVTPEVYGVYALVVFLMVFLSVFGGTGLASNLIRLEREPTDLDRGCVFLAQGAIVLALSAALTLTAPELAAWYHLQISSGTWLFRLVGLSLLVTSFQVMPQITLERDLRFGVIAAIETSQSLAFNATAIVLAWRGLGATAFGVALATRAILGAVASNIASPTQAAPKWNWPITREHLTYGLYFQGVNAISLIKEAINPIFIGAVVSMAAVGYANWGMFLAGGAVIALNGLQRVFLPAFALATASAATLQSLAERAIQAVNAIAAPIMAFSLVFIRPITHTVFGDKWLAAIPLFYLFWLGDLLTPTTTVLLALLNAVGRARTTFRLAAFWLTVTWLLGIPLIYRQGAMGFAIASFVAGSTGAVVFPLAKRTCHIRIARTALPPWAIAAATCAIVGALLGPTTADSTHRLALAAVEFTALYGAALAFVFRRSVRSIATALRVR